MKPFKRLVIVLGLMCITWVNYAADTLLVSQDNSGDFNTITAALESLPMYCYERVVIVIKEGVYNEKIRIDRDYLTLIGESREKTSIVYNQLRDDWNNNPDAIGPAVVNIFADDIILKNLTITNTQPELGPHAFAIYGTGTRTIIKNCTVKSKGGDTVSLWNYKEGMYYHDSCYFEGAVDFVCPRGWCYISNSTFYEHKNTAAVWHAAPVNPNQKFVLYNCNFQGADSFYLARHHYDAQFYFIRCSFPALMQNKPVEHVYNPRNPEKNRPYIYGDRYYFYQCSRKAGNYSWFADNLFEWPQAANPETITPEWTFNGAWNPIADQALPIKKIEINDTVVLLWFSELVMQSGSSVLVSKTGKLFQYYAGSGSYRLEFRTKSNTKTTLSDFPFKVKKGTIASIKAGVEPRYLKTIEYLP